MDHLSKIKTFVLVAQAGSFSGAARELNISTAAVSKQIASLEHQSEVQLLIRSTRKVELTEIGYVYYEQCQRIIEEVDTSYALLSQMKVLPSGKLRVFTSKHFAQTVIFPNLAEFLSLYPEIELDFIVEERVPHLESENIDIFIGASLPAQENSLQKRITTTRYTICAAPSYLEKFGVPQSADDLSQHRCIAHSGRQPCHFFYGENGKDISFSPYIKVNDADSLALLALEGIGIVQLHHYVVQKMINEKKLVELLYEFTRKDVPIYYALPSRRYTPRKTKCFLDFIVSKLNQ